MMSQQLCHCGKYKFILIKSQGGHPMYAECINPPNELFTSGELYQYSQPGEDYEIYVSDYYTLLLSDEQFDYYFRQV